MTQEEFNKVADEHDIVIEVRGGVADIIKVPEGCSAIIIDWDNEED